MDSLNRQRKRPRDNTDSITKGALSYLKTEKSNSNDDDDDNGRRTTPMKVLSLSKRNECEEQEETQQQLQPVSFPVNPLKAKEKNDDTTSKEFVRKREKVGRNLYVIGTTNSVSCPNSPGDTERSSHQLSIRAKSQTVKNDIIDLTSSPEAIVSTKNRRDNKKLDISSKPSVKDSQKDNPFGSDRSYKRSGKVREEGNALKSKSNEKLLSAFGKRKNTTSLPFANKFNISTQQKSKQIIAKSKKSEPSKTTAGTDSSSAMWIDKHSPTSLDELVVAPKKIKEVKEWLEAAFSNDTNQNRTTKGLILTGNPGIGKSTMARVLAKEHNLNILEWHEGTRPSSSTFGQSSSWLFTKSNTSEMRASPSREQTPLDSFKEFLDSTGTGFTSLSIFGGKGIERSKKKHKTTKSLILIDEIPNLYSTVAEDRFRAILSEHMIHTTTPTIMIYSDVTEGNVNELQLSRLVEEKLLHHNMFITIIHINKATNAKMKKCLSSIVKRERLSLPSSNDLDDVCETCAGDIRCAIMTLQFHLAANAYGSMSSMAKLKKPLGKAKSVGNIGNTRKKDTRLSSFHALGKALYAKRCAEIQHDEKKLDNSSMCRFGDRDYVPTWKSFKWKDERPPLNFDPESVLLENPMGIEGAITFLQYHCVDFFTDEIELSEALATYSDALGLGSAGKIYGSRMSSYDNYTFPDMYKASLAGRAVADANKNPMPNKWRALDAPKTFEVRRKILANEQILEHMCRRFSHQSSMMNSTLPLLDDRHTRAILFSLPPDSCLGSSSVQFVTRTLPYLRRIYPDGVNEFMSAMHSASSKSTEEKNNQQTKYRDRQISGTYTRSHNTNAKEDSIMLQNLLDHSKAILKEDDIVDDEEVLQLSLLE